MTGCLRLLGDKDISFIDSRQCFRAIFSGSGTLLIDFFFWERLDGIGKLRLVLSDKGIIRGALERGFLYAQE